MLALSLCVLGILAPGAHAALVEARDSPQADHRGDTYVVRTVYVTAAPGEANRLELTLLDRNGVRVHDPAGSMPKAPCLSEAPDTVVCPGTGGLMYQVALGDGDDTFTTTIDLPGEVSAGEGDDVVRAPARIDGGPGDDQLTGSVVKGGPGADTLAGPTLDFSDRTQGVTVDVPAGTAVSAGETDHFAPGTRQVFTGVGPDVVRMGHAFDALTGDGDDVIEGGPGNDWIDAGEGDNVVHGGGGGDVVLAGAGNDRLDGGDGGDQVYGGDGDDVIEGGSGFDQLVGGPGADRLLARDGEHDRADCALGSRSALGPQDDRATLDARDSSSWCTHIDRTGPGRLELRGITPTSLRSARLVVSCNRRRACSARLHAQGAVAAPQRVRVRAGRTVRVPVRLRRAGGTLSVRLVTPQGELRATLLAAPG